MIALFFFVVAAIAGTCETCLESGGAWHAATATCTTDCDLQDMDCYASETGCSSMRHLHAGRSTCETCLESGGAWHAATATCTTDCDLQDMDCYASETGCSSMRHLHAGRSCNEITSRGFCTIHSYCVWRLETRVCADDHRLRILSSHLIL
eukprot:GEMP01047479.1.p1 GENE.GEMP01047479.1~~GEMP01047479.1.p1  ORF type:complete len:151 (+),score=16.05 GEMP01047479.1:81-533(+)